MMLVTEEEAKTKWCPFVRRNPVTMHGPTNRPSHDGYNCIGSECMLWEKLSEEVGGDQRGQCGMSRWS